MKRVKALSLVVSVGATVLVLVACRHDELGTLNPGAGLNGGFEALENGYPVNWAFFPNPESGASVQVVSDSEQVVEGRRSLKLVVKQNGKTTGFRSRRIPIQPGKKYKIALSVKADGCTLNVNRIVQDPSGKKNLRSKIIVHTGNLSAQWEKYEELLSAAEGEAGVLLIFLIEGTGTLWCDGVSIEEME